MYRIEGDGTWAGTMIWKDNELVEGWESCTLYIDAIDDCVAAVDGDFAPVSRLVLLGIHQLVGDGKFGNTKFLVNDGSMRGVLFIELVIKRDEPTNMTIGSVFLPYIIEEIQDGI